MKIQRRLFAAEIQRKHEKLEERKLIDAGRCLFIRSCGCVDEIVSIM